ncbi:zinc-ribbon domain-containing protein [Myxococcota bacterium]|jgi:hypothetical protein|nr:zinc-ribbon domain-containing protein [Myxococcota bacterium]
MPKSGKKRRAELLERRREKKLPKPPEAPSPPPDSAPVDASQLKPFNSYGAPVWLSRGYYEDIEFRCRDCHQEHTWTARAQKWYFEQAKGVVWGQASRCRDCSAKEQLRRAEARRVWAEGLAKKRARQQEEQS